MSVTMTPISGGSTEGGYLTVAQARTLAATLPGMAALLAKTDDELGVLLLAASLDIDTALPYQGLRYETDQERAFPRYQRVTDRGNIRQPHESLAGGGSGDGSGSGGVGVWDWDSATNTAVEPAQVKTACLYQAASLLNPQFAARLDAIRSGLASQSTGSLAESYFNPADLPGGLTGLCAAAQRLMDRYRLRTAPLL